MFKKIFTMLLCAFLCVHAFAKNNEKKSLFWATYGGIKFFSDADVMRAYIGTWNGIQQISFGEQKVGGRIDITYSQVESNGDFRIMGIGKITSNSGRSVPTSSYMYSQNGMLILEMRTASGVASFYKGVRDFSSVIWVPVYGFMAFDFQQDFFFVEDDTDCINAVGAREISYKNNVGILQIHTIFRKIKTSKPASELNSSMKKNIDVKLDGGVKFGK